MDEYPYRKSEKLLNHYTGGSDLDLEPDPSFSNPSGENAKTASILINKSSKPNKLQ